MRNNKTENTSFSHARIGTWNINTLNAKINAIKDIIHRFDIHILGLTETKWNGKNINAHFSEYQWICRKAQTPNGGVGFLIHNSILLQRKYEIINGTDSNSIFLLLQSNTHRNTLLALVYGNSNPTKLELTTQWKNYLKDLNKIKRKFKSHIYGRHQC